MHPIPHSGETPLLPEALLLLELDGIVNAAGIRFDKTPRDAAPDGAAVFERYDPPPQE